MRICGFTAALGSIHQEVLVHTCKSLLTNISTGLFWHTHIYRSLLTYIQVSFYTYFLHGNIWVTYTSHVYVYASMQQPLVFMYMSLLTYIHVSFDIHTCLFWHWSSAPECLALHKKKSCCIDFQITYTCLFWHIYMSLLTYIHVSFDICTMHQSALLHTRKSLVTYIFSNYIYMSLLTYI